MSAVNTSFDLATNDNYASMRVIRNENTSGGSADGMYIGFSNGNSGTTRIYGGGGIHGGLWVTGSGASDVLIAGNVAWNAGNDGSASGLDADLVDGIDGYRILTIDTNKNISSRLVFFHNEQNNTDTIATATGGLGGLEIRNAGIGNDAFMTFHAAGDHAFYFGLDATTNDLSVGGWSKGAVKYRIWHAGNDGSGSGLDADTLDGINSGSFLRSDTNAGFSGGALSFGTTTRQMLNLWGSTYALGVQNNTLYCRSATRFSWFRGGVHSEAQNNAGGGTVAMTLDGSSNLTVTGSVTSNSDITLKKNIEVIPNALDKVSQIRGVTFDRIDMEDESRQSGVIAQEVEKVLPEVVQENDEGIKSIAYGNMVGLLIEAIKEQQEQIDILKKEIEELKK
jgi:hypothetical protein